MRVKKLYLIFLILFFSSCSDFSDEENTENVVLSANILLSESKCQDAIDLLENFGRRMNNAVYVETLSSAYACRAGFNEPTFYTRDISTIGSSGTSLFGSLVQWPTSVVTGVDDAKFADLQMAIDLILSTGIESSPSALDRLNTYGDEKGNDLNTQVLYMILAQLGKYAFFYGNANPTAGTKGTGAISNGNSNNNTNNCYLTYSAAQNTTANTIIVAVTTDSCDDGEAGHPALETVTQELKVQRACQGVVLFNNLIDTFSNVTISTASTSLGNLGTLQSGLGTILSAVCSTYTGVNPLVCSVTSQSVCETELGVDPANNGTDTGSNSLYVYFSAIYESLFN